MPKQVRKWEGTRSNCELCNRDIRAAEFVDGRTRQGPWALMCLPCHKEAGVGLGMGRGQRYDATGVKVEG